LVALPQSRSNEIVDGLDCGLEIRSLPEQTLGALDRRIRYVIRGHASLIIRI
jgi:hypothetical protein